MMMMANNNSGEAKGGTSAGNAQPNEAAAAGGGGSGGGDESGSDGGGGGGGGGASANASTGDSEVNIRRGLDVIQSMIDISADRLEGLRTQCATSAELTQQEIRTLETKLVKLFSDLLITKSKLPERLPARGLPATGNELKQWLRVVGLSCASLNAVIQQVSTLEGLLEKDDKELRTIMGNNVYVREEEIKRLTRASGNLKRYREQLDAVAGGRKVNAGDAMHDLFWDSWDRQPACHRTSPRVNRSLAGAKCNKPNINYRHNNGPPAAPMAAVSGGGEFHADQQHITSPQSEESMASQHHHHHHQHHHQQQHHNYHHQQQQHHEQLLNPHHTISPDEASTSGCTPSPSPPNSPSSVMLHGKQQQQQQQQNRKGFPTTPPPKRKHQTALLTSSSSSSASSASTVTGTATVTTTQSAGAVAACAGGTNPADAASAAALTKSKSHESQFGGGGGANNNHAVNNNNNNNNNNGSSAGPGGGGPNHNPLYLVNNNNNIPTNVVPLGSNHEAGGPVVVTSTTTTGSNILSDSGMAANQRPMGNGSAGNRMGTFPRSRLHTEPTITSSNTTVSPSGGTTQPDHLPHPHQHHHHHHHHHHLHHGAPHHHPPAYHHHLQQQATGGGQSDSGEYGDGPPIIGHGSVPPKSPCTPIITRGMGHMIQHRFTKKFKVTKSTCDLCNKQMFFGYKCTECKYRCHRDCMQNVPPSCGLPQEFVDEFKKSLQSDTLLPTSVSPNIGRPPGGGTMIAGAGGGMMYVASARAGTLVRGPMHAIHACGGPDSSSAGSSCNSSSPSSPALLSLPPQTPGTSRQFNFPEVPNGQGVPGGGGGMMMASTISTTGGGSLIASAGGGSLGSGGGITIETHPIGGSTGGGGHAVRSVGSSGYGGDSGGTIEIPTLQFSDIPDRDGAVLGGENDKTGSASATSTDSSSDRTPIRLDSTEERDHESSWPRQNSLSFKEWDIPYDDLHLKEKIGNGRFGTVHRALWHGDVAVKLLKEGYVADDRTLEAFKLEVATFKKTRHENVVLFMGACMNPPRLAIVTSLCKGNTLFTHIHLRKDKFNLNRTTLVAQQISQGMGYLHARGIVHKDLKTKNIFLENGKVIITDFGLFSATKLLYCELGLGIPSGWLCYLAPELMCNLTPYRPVEGDLPFSRASDIYAFGTVWYELLCGEFPFKSQPAESIIWQVGRGMKQTLANLQASRDVKDILIKCWNYHLDDRPDFAKLLNLLERLPKKRLARSPSHPVQLSRSAESVF